VDVTGGAFSRGMILCAGEGRRLRPLTASLAKPLIEIQGKSCLVRALDHMSRFGIECCVVNARHLAQQVSACVDAYGASCPSMSLHVSVEEESLESGGGVKKALPLLGDKPFFVVNGDIVWREEGDSHVFQRLVERWDGKRMDIAMMVLPTPVPMHEELVGDFDMEESWRGWGRLFRGSKPFSYVFSGIQLLSPHLFAETQGLVSFSLRRLYDEAWRKGRLYGVTYGGVWYHLSSLDHVRASAQWTGLSRAP